MQVAKSISNFFSNEDGVTAIEYGVLGALIGSILAGVVSALYPELTSGYDTLGMSFKAAASF